MSKTNKKQATKNIKECTFYVKGMHCSSCELLIEKELLEKKGVKAVDASTSNETVTIEYQGKKPGLSYLNKIFKDDNYQFSTLSAVEEEDDCPAISLSTNGQLIFNQNKLIFPFFVALIVIAGFLLINKSGFTSVLSVNSQSSLIAFIAFGIIAGLSTCSALVGGIILSMSKQWSELYSKDDSLLTRMQPNFMFNAGRLVAYALFGALLGLIGNFLQISLEFTSLLTIAVSVFMAFLGLEMLGVKKFAKFKLVTPKFFTRFVANEKNFAGRFMPFVMGALTFILPCGFTITTQGLALVSGSWLQGMLIMLFFALGTLPSLLAIGLSSISLNRNRHFAEQFAKVAGILVLFFAAYNVNSQLNVLGLPSFSDLSNTEKQVSAKFQDDLPPIVNGKQVIKMTASARAYSPNKFQVKVGVPVRWEITDTGTSGCTNAVISKELFNGEIKLTPGKTSIKEFIPQKAGRYKFSCWMGMVSGIIDVVDESGNLDVSDTELIPAGDSEADGCDGSCGGDCGGGCGCGG